MGIVKYLVDQSGNPSGIVGRLLLKAMDRAHGKIIAKALEPIRATASRQVLDIGCGSGYALKIMNHHFQNSTLHGIDISETCIQKARQMNLRVLNQNSMDIRLGDVQVLSFNDNTLDIVTAFQTHYFWPDLQRACQEIRRVLKPGGLFILCGDLYKMEYHLAIYRYIEEYPGLLKAEGFCEIQAFPFNGFMIAYSRK